MMHTLIIYLIPSMLVVLWVSSYKIKGKNV